MAANEWVDIYHPQQGDQAFISRVRLKAFNTVWRRKGFVILDPVVAKAGAMIGNPVKKLGDLTKDDLATVVTIAGGEVADKDSKEVLEKKVTAALGGVEPVKEAANG